MSREADDAGESRVSTQSSLNRGPSMAISVASLLNPLPSGSDENLGSPNDVWLDTPTLTRGSCTPSTSSNPQTPVLPSAFPRKPQFSSKPTSKLPKDAPVFTSNPTSTRGLVRFAPYEFFEQSPSNSHLLNELERFSIYPLGTIATHGVRHIPYASDKKSFHDRTGREGFDVFQYTFSLPQELRVAAVATQKNEYSVMWDYNIGLVRITPFFKSCGYSKTTPAKMLHQNPTLRPLSHSITGGSLAAQGYWLPFEAAKYICATFTFPIRYALVPLFGPKFVDLCIPPTSPDWARMICPVEIIEQAARELARIKETDCPSIPSPLEPTNRPVAETKTLQALKLRLSHQPDKSSQIKTTTLHRKNDGSIRRKRDRDEHEDNPSTVPTSRPPRTYSSPSSAANSPPAVPPPSPFQGPATNQSPIIPLTPLILFQSRAQPEPHVSSASSPSTLSDSSNSYIEPTRDSQGHDGTPSATDVEISPKTTTRRQRRTRSAPNRSTKTISHKRPAPSIQPNEFEMLNQALKRRRLAREKEWHESEAGSQIGDIDSADDESRYSGPRTETERDTAFLLMQLKQADEELVRLRERVGLNERGEKRARRASR